jgi:hypothetical protein
MSNYKQNPLQHEDELIPILLQNQDFINSSNSALNSYKKNHNLKKSNYQKPTFNLSQFMSYNFSHFTKFSIAGLAVFALLAGGLSAQAFAPENLKPSNLLADSNTVPTNFKFSDCNTSLRVTSITEKVSTDNYNKLEYGDTIFVKAEQGNDGIRIRCYPLDGTISWNNIFDFNLKSQNKSFRYSFNKFYCQKVIGEGEINKYSFGCVDEPVVSKITKQDLPFLSDSFKSQLDENTIYYKDVGVLLNDKTDESDYDFFSTYYFSTKDNHSISISLKKLDYFKNKVKIDLK